MIDFNELQRDSVRWPFSRMEINETIEIKDFKGKSKTYIQRMAHNYGTSSGKRFETKTSGGKLYVHRVA